jgi:hypothetical protein
MDENEKKLRVLELLLVARRRKKLSIDAHRASSRERVSLLDLVATYFWNGM